MFEGLRIGRGKPGLVRYHEFGRVLRGEGERRIGRRAHGAPVWEMLGDEALRSLELQPAPASISAGWPDEDEAELQTVLDLGPGPGGLTRGHRRPDGPHPGGRPVGRREPG